MVGVQLDDVERFFVGRDRDLLLDQYPHFCPSRCPSTFVSPLLFQEKRKKLRPFALSVPFCFGNGSLNPMREFGIVENSLRLCS